ncbi:uncharacterized protein LOC142330069 isoform X3 [Lycorma delicatula]|uniref:uncharacterized protein LOC142330069 isoform X3 n=1 Tax=Lycorma delicatula TaxID=130591 RepID=UPI003F50F2E8
MKEIKSQKGCINKVYQDMEKTNLLVIIFCVFGGYSRPAEHNTKLQPTTTQKLDGEHNYNTKEINTNQKINDNSIKKGTTANKLISNSSTEDVTFVPNNNKYYNKSNNPTFTKIDDSITTTPATVSNSDKNVNNSDNNNNPTFTKIDDSITTTPATVSNSDKNVNNSNNNNNPTFTKIDDSITTKGKTNEGKKIEIQIKKSSIAITTDNSKLTIELNTSSQDKIVIKFSNAIITYRGGGNWLY